MVPPTSIWTGAVYRDAAATHGMPVILWLKASGAGGVGVGEEELDMVGEVAGELLWTDKWLGGVISENFTISGFFFFFFFFWKSISRKSDCQWNIKLVPTYQPTKHKFLLVLQILL